MSNFGRTTYRAARKGHRCAICHLDIEIGTVHIDGSSVYDGRWSRWRAHAECNRLDEQLQHIRAYDPEEPGQDVQSTLFHHGTTLADLRESGVWGRIVDVPGVNVALARLYGTEEAQDERKQRETNRWQSMPAHGESK